MSALETYAKQALTTRGTEHMHAIDSLRRYIRLTPDEDLTNYINMIIDQDILRTLIEVGMRNPLWRVTVSRMNLLRKEIGRAHV